MTTAPGSGQLWTPLPWLVRRWYDICVTIGYPAARGQAREPVDKAALAQVEPPPVAPEPGRTGDGGAG